MRGSQRNPPHISRKAQRALVAVLAAITAAVSGLVTNVVTQRASWALWAAFGTLALVTAAAAGAIELLGDSQPPSPPVQGGPGQPVRQAPELTMLTPDLVFEDVDVAGFTGRGWLIQKLDHFIETLPRGYLSIEAEPGPAQPVYAAWIVRQRCYLSHFTR